MARRKVRKDKRVQVQVDLGYENGKRKRKSFYGKTIREAEQNRDLWVEEEKRKERLMAGTPDITLEGWSDLWLESVKGSTEKNTYSHRKSAAKMQNKYVLPDVMAPNGTTLGSMQVREIKPVHIQAYMSSLAGMSKGTIKSRRFALRSMLNAAVANGIIDKSPWEGVKAPKGTYVGHRTLDDNEKSMICDTWRGHRCGIWALAMCYTGMRPEEMAAITEKSVDFRLGHISIENASALYDGGRIKPTKTEAGIRQIPLLPQIEQPLREYIMGRESGPLFVSAAGKPLTETALRRAWSSYMRYLNLCSGGTDSKRGKDDPVTKEHTRIPAKWVIKTFTPYDLRYTYATYLYDAGVDVKTAAYLLGHADITVTMAIYTQLSKRKKLTGIDMLLQYSKEDFDHHFDHQVADESGE